MLAAAISGGDRDAIRTGLEVDAALATAVATSVIEGPPERRRRPQSTAPLSTSASVTFRSSGPSLAPYTIEYVINLYRPTMEACTEFAQEGGTVYVSFYLPEYGRPENVRVRGEPAVRPCIHDLVEQMEFPLSTRGSNVSFAHRY